MEGWDYFERTIQRIGRNERPFDKQPALTFLTEVVHTTYYLGLESLDGAMSPWYLGLFLRLPTLRALQANSIHNSKRRLDDSGIDFATLPSGVSSLMHLELRGSSLHRDDLRLILRSSNILKTFIYELGRLDHIIDLQNSLEPAEKTLETLWLDYQAWWYEGKPGRLGIQSVNFTPFTSLTFLHVSSAFLYGDPKPSVSTDYQGRPLRGTFPAQLEILEISSPAQEDPATFLYSLEDLLRGKQQGTELVNLKRLILLRGPRFPERTYPFWSSRVLVVVEAAESAGVEMKLCMNWYRTLPKSLQHCQLRHRFSLMGTGQPKWWRKDIERWQE